MKKKFFSLCLLIFGRCAVAGARNYCCRIGAAGLLLTMLAGIAHANVAPEVVIHSAEMRPGTTYMDISFRVNDPDDATVKVRALAFIDGVRSFTNVIRPETFVEGTDANLGNAIPANQDLVLTWNVAVDWDIDLEQVKFEILALDDRGLLEFDWVTIPATDETEAFTISLNAPTDQEILNALFWLYADGDDWLTVEDGLLKGAAGSVFFEGEILVNGVSLQNAYLPTLFVYNRINLILATNKEVLLAIRARSGISDPLLAYAANRPWSFDQVGADQSASSSEEVSNRWVKHTYADGSVTMSDRFTRWMWIDDATANAPRNWDDAMAYSANLVYAGYDDWSLPNIPLLKTMHGQHVFFSNVPWAVWSAQHYGDRAWFVNLNDGSHHLIHQSNTRGVWPHRY